MDFEASDVDYPLSILLQILVKHKTIVSFLSVLEVLFPDTVERDGTGRHSKLIIESSELKALHFVVLAEQVEVELNGCVVD